MEYELLEQLNEWGRKTGLRLAVNGTPDKWKYYMSIVQRIEHLNHVYQEDSSYPQPVVYIRKT